MKHEITERTAVRRLGLITIDLGFEALPGMVWHADTFDFDVQHQVWILGSQFRFQVEELAFT